MSEILAKCPNCNEPIYVEIEDCGEDETYEDTCPKCDKKFCFYINYSVNIFTDKIKERK